MKHAASNEAIVIGAGIGGLATAVRLAAQGWQVQVFESLPYVGGKLSWFEQDGYSFDAGPSLFTRPALLEQLFSDAGHQLADFFQYQRVDPICHYFFANGKQLQAPADTALLAQQMATSLGEDADAVRQYLDTAKASYQHIGELFLEYSLHRPRLFPWGRVPGALRHTQLSFLRQSMHAYNQKHLRTPEAVQLMNRYATYNGSNPYQAPAMLSMIPHLEMNEGTFYPRGGMISITQAIHQLALKMGVRFHLGTPVQRIIHHTGQAHGVVVNGQNVQASLVVSNADAYFTYKHLLADEAGAARLLKQERSSSALIFYWGIGQSFPQLNLHNIFFSNDYAEEFSALFRQGRFGADPTVYINITSKMEEGQAPAGKENWFVMVNAPAHRGQPWDQWIPELRNRVLQKLQQQLGADIAAAIETEAILDPPTIESRTSSYMGSLYGTSSNSRFAAFLRQPNAARHIKGLYMVGGSVHPGGGIPLCLNSAAITANLIAHDYRRPLFATPNQPHVD